MKLYDYAPAPNPKRARMLFAEKGIEVEIIPIDLRKKEQFSDDFKTINPRCTLPAFDYGQGQALTEFIAIADYLDNTFSELPIIGSTNEERAQAIMWNCICEQTGMMPVGEIFRNSSPFFVDSALPGGIPLPQIEALVERGQIRLQAFFTQLEQQLSQNEFVAGKHFSIADITAFIIFDFMKFTGLEPPQGFKHIDAWLHQVQQRPSTNA